MRDWLWISNLIETVKECLPWLFFFLLFYSQPVFAGLCEFIDLSYDRMTHSCALFCFLHLDACLIVK